MRALKRERTRRRKAENRADQLSGSTMRLSGQLGAERSRANELERKLNQWLQKELTETTLLTPLIMTHLAGVPYKIIYPTREPAKFPGGFTLVLHPNDADGRTIVRELEATEAIIVFAHKYEKPHPSSDRLHELGFFGRSLM